MKKKFLSCFFLATFLWSQTAIAGPDESNGCFEWFKSFNPFSYKKLTNHAEEIKLADLHRSTANLMTLEGKQSSCFSFLRNKNFVPLAVVASLLIVGGITTAILATRDWSGEDCQNLYNQWETNWEDRRNETTHLGEPHHLRDLHQNISTDVMQLLERLGLSKLENYINIYGFQEKIPVFIHNSSFSVDQNNHLVTGHTCVNPSPESLKKLLGLPDLDEETIEKLWKSYNIFPHKVGDGLYQMFHNPTDFLTEFIPSRLIPWPFEGFWNNICTAGETVRALLENGQLMPCNFKDRCTDSASQATISCFQNVLIKCQNYTSIILGN